MTPDNPKTADPKTSESRRILLGQIGAAHGIKGEVSIKTYTADPTAIAAYGPLTNKDGTRAFDIKVVRVTDKGVVARITGEADRTAVEKLRNIELYVERSKLPPPSDDEFYHEDLIGMAVADTTGNRRGVVKSVANFGAGDLLEVEFSEPKLTEFVPFTKAAVPAIDIANHIITIDPAAYTPVGEPEPASENGDEADID